MPSRCVAMYCSHEGSRLYEWPVKKSLARIWTLFVRVKRRNFTPAARSVLCYKHFSDECFENLIRYNFGYTKMLRLKSGAVPTIHLPGPDELQLNIPVGLSAPNTNHQNHNSNTPASIPRSAYAKRERSRQIDAALSEYLLLDCQTNLDISGVEPVESAAAAVKKKALCRGLVGDQPAQDLTPAEELAAEFSNRRPVIEGIQEVSWDRVVKTEDGVVKIEPPDNDPYTQEEATFAAVECTSAEEETLSMDSRRLEDVATAQQQKEACNINSQTIRIQYAQHLHKQTELAELQIQREKRNLEVIELDVEIKKRTLRKLDLEIQKLEHEVNIALCNHV
ncbi:uncharacterized protein LOC130920817 isoform X1 [Corythoichthys intestinalis]|uniref:uncharacterized protein LOC130920817 isoform X1 n=1 Tax=Corythoichthys intestinalis TaxID=161448 RepID=UPI0025A52444|nr:uncharacterized protein LOC130920817 isoform X1 [Corythoichthys intestinalis]